jgi:alanyl-tRNA synthetase
MTQSATQSKFSVADIRKTFLDFYAAKGHTVVPSSSLVPGNDPTLMFTNSGMVQFKDVFLGLDKRPYVRAASVQACLRAGGKHNDLENVGYTARHHTFFEMLGNWSFGDYFKRDSLKWGWELLTKVYGLPAEKLLVTVYIDDQEAYDIWRNEIGLPADRIVRIGDNKGKKYASDNFWMMADTGPCGPCSEIFYDHGAHIPGGPPGSPEEDGDRFIEIWNHVFMQFDMQADGSLVKLPAPCVDTGMGLERLAAILQHVHSNYEIDIFDALIKAAARETGCTDMQNKSLRVIADHIRATAFLVSDGVVPSNEGRGYVQRRIVRRAIRHGYQLGKKTPFFHKLVADLVGVMGEAYPNMAKQQQRITEVLKTEEVLFLKTLSSGLRILSDTLDLTQALETCMSQRTNFKYIGSQTATDNVMGYSFGLANLDRPYNPSEMLDVFIKTCPLDDAEEDDLALEMRMSRWSANKIVVDRSWSGLQLEGEVAFKLHDTYGFPLDLTADVCRDRGVEVDEAGFDAAMLRQKTMARAAGKFKMDKALEYSGALNEFVGYEHLQNTTKIIAIYVDNTPATAINSGENGVIVLESTPFYAESGGQVGDEGEISYNFGLAKTAVFNVQDTQKIKADVYGHHGVLSSGSLKVGDSVTAQVNLELRAKTIRNHSATHLMHRALREVLGEHVQQKGSLVNAERTRFDFAHNAPVTDAQILAIEAKVNTEILANAAASAKVMDIESAKATGAMMLFGEKYGETVRVLEIGSSKELCGGVHVQRTGDIGLFKIVSEGGIASGVRRIEAVTGQNALAYLQDLEATVSKAAGALKVAVPELGERLQSLLDQNKALEKEISALKGQLASHQGDALLSQAVDLKGIKFLVAKMEGVSAADAAQTLRDTVGKLKDKLKSAVVVLASVDGGKVQLATGATADVMGKVKSGELVNFLAAQVGGKGGGRPDMAMAGGTDASGLDKALASAQGWVSERLG